MLDAVDDQPVSFRPAFDSSQGYTIDLADSGSLRVLPSLGDTANDLDPDPRRADRPHQPAQHRGRPRARRRPRRLHRRHLRRARAGRPGRRTDDHRDRGRRRHPEHASPAAATSRSSRTASPARSTCSCPASGCASPRPCPHGPSPKGTGRRSGSSRPSASSSPAASRSAAPAWPSSASPGLFAMHQHRLENTSARIPALDWLVNVAQGNPTRLQAWGPALDQWAFGVGIVAGTMEGGTILNLKGMLVLELPGPRVLILAKANLLKKRPPTLGTETGALFAVVDIAPDHVLIGVQIDYVITHVVEAAHPRRRRLLPRASRPLVPRRRHHRQPRDRQGPRGLRRHGVPRGAR